MGANKGFSSCWIENTLKEAKVEARRLIRNTSALAIIQVRAKSGLDQGDGGGEES